MLPQSPNDDQTQPRIQLEASSKLMIQTLVTEKKIDLTWSYVVEFENAKNPYPEIRNTILAFKKHAAEIIEPSQSIEDAAINLQSKGFKAYDSLHIACAVHAGCDYFLTVDDKVLNKQQNDIEIMDPVVFINNWLKGGITP